jgi:hypothetical protein
MFNERLEPSLEEEEKRRNVILKLKQVFLDFQYIYVCMYVCMYIVFVLFDKVLMGLDVICVKVICCD